VSTNAAFPILIGTRRYTADLRGFGWEPVPSVKAQQDQSREPDDGSLSASTIWKRTQSDFIQGAGQDYFDQEQESDRRRFRTSKGIDVWDRRQLTLLPDVDVVSTAGTGSVAASISTGDYAYFSTGSNVLRWNGSAIANCTGESGTIASLAVVGGYVYAGGTGTLGRVAVGDTAFSSYGSTAPDVIGTAGGRLVGGEGALLYEILSGGAKTDIYTHFEGSGFEWKKIIGAPNGIYCFGDDSGRSIGYLLTVVDATGELAPPYPVLQMPDGVFVRDVLFFGGVLVLATNIGVQLATINGSGFLTAGPLIEIGDVKCLCTDGRDIWFGWSDFQSVSGLGRLRPERFTDTLVPAYASDLMTTYSGTTLSCTSFQGKRMFIVDDSSTMRLLEESDNKVSSGEFRSGVVTYGTPELKAVHSVEGSWDALPAGATVSLDVTATKGGSALPGGVTNSTTGSTSERGELTTTLSTEEAEVIITLNRATDATVAPVLRRWTLRALITPFRTKRVVLAVYLRTQVEHVVQGTSVGDDLDVLDEFEYLNGLMESRTPVSVTIGSRTEEMLVDSVRMGPDVQGVGAVGWTTEQDWLEGTWAVELVTLEPSTS
jgi:hypothetical protein